MSNMINKTILSLYYSFTAVILYNLVYETWHAVRGCQKNHFEPIRPIPKHHLVHFTDPNKSTDSKVGNLYIV